MKALSKKSALVTGSGSGIGREIALALAREGAIVGLLDRDEFSMEQVARAIRNNNCRAVCYPIDLTRDDDLRPLSGKVEQDLGRLDILIHSAGIFHLGRSEDEPVSDLDDMYRVNVRGPYILTQVMLPMLKQSKGQVVFINSSAGLKAGEGWGAYSMTKGALKMLADSLRDEVNSEGIRVLSVFPGRTATPMQQEVHRLEKRDYLPERLMQAQDVAIMVIEALKLPRTAEVTDIMIRPALKS